MQPAKVKNLAIIVWFMQLWWGGYLMKRDFNIAIYVNGRGSASVLGSWMKKKRASLLSITESCEAEWNFVILLKL